MRLIDADELKKNYINIFADKYGVRCGEMFKGVIDQTTTAYNVDEVEKEVYDITCRIHNYCEEIDHNIPEEERTGYNMLEDINLLREIVRKGGV